MAEPEQPTLDPVKASITFDVTAALAPKRFRVRVMGSGFGLNYEFDDDGTRCQWFVPDDDAGIGSAVRTFGGAKVHWNVNDAGEYDHAGGWTPANELGYLSDLAVVEGGLEATLHVHDGVPDEIVDVIRTKRAGLSIEANAERRPSIRDGKAVMELINFSHPQGGPASVALVTNPALSGEILRIAASRRDAMSAEKQATATVAKPAEAAGTDPNVLAAIEAEKAKVDAALEQLQADREKLEQDRKVDALKASVEKVLTAEELPELATAMLRNTYHARIEAGHEVTEDEVKAAAGDARKALRASAPSAGVEIGTEKQDRTAIRMENLFVRNAPGYVKAAFDREAGAPLSQRLRDAGLSDKMEPSVLRLFRESTGSDFRDLRDRSRTKAVQASISTSTWGDAWENVINRAMLFTYRENPDYQDWRKVARVVPVQNFVKQERIVKGGYANLSTVAEGANYGAATSPGDEGHGYTPSKRGYTEDVTWEAMLRDDVGALTDLPVKMGLAASRTLYETVLDNLTIAGQPTMDYDATTLFHADHGNLDTTALGSAQLIVRIKAMMKQADLTTSKRLGVVPKNILVPIDLANTAFDLVKSLTTFPGGATTDYEWIRRFAMELIVVRHWTNTTDWFLTADPTQFPVMEVGFVNGQEEPELYVQDNANFGSMFDADKITYKLKHSYGATVLRHEGVDGNNVA